MKKNRPLRVKMFMMSVTTWQTFMNQVNGFLRRFCDLEQNGARKRAL